MIRSKVSKRYAKALFSLGREDGSFERLGQELSEFVQFCKDNPEFRQTVADPVFTVEDRKKILSFVLEKSTLSVAVKNFLSLLLDKDRIGGIEAITEYYAKLTDEVAGIARAEIITARPLKGETLGRLEKALEKMTSRKIKADVKEAPDLIGGLVVKIGDMVLDGSVRTQIEGLKEIS